jgi:hypothetical protein
MKTLLSLLVLLFVSVSFAQARLNETFDECKKRYEAKEFRQGTTSNIYTCKPTPEIILALTFRNKICVSVTYALANEEDFTKDQLVQLIKVNTGVIYEKWQIKTEEHNFIELTTPGYAFYVMLKSAKYDQMYATVMLESEVELREKEKQQSDLKTIEGI